MTLLGRNGIGGRIFAPRVTVVVCKEERMHERVLVPCWRGPPTTNDRGMIGHLPHGRDIGSSRATDVGKQKQNDPCG